MNNFLNIATWNVNGWTVSNSRIRQDILLSLSYDVVCVVETFFKNDDNLELNGYKWYGQNRTMLHSRASRGSGGLGFLVKLDILSYFDCGVIDSDQEGVLILQLINKVSQFKICLYAIYLPPERSMRGRNPDSFFEYLLNKCYMYSDHDINIIMGDFNARVGNKTDFILDVDESLPLRANIDDTVNRHGDSLMEFCIDSKYIIVNGRITPEKDNYTFVSSRGRSVVDYILTPQSDIHFFTESKVLLVSDIINTFSLTPPEGGTEGSLPDHSVVCATVYIHYEKQTEVIETQVNKVQRYKRQNIPDDFMMNDDILQATADIVDQMERFEQTHQTIDAIYEKICNIYMAEMNSKLLKSNSHSMSRSKTRTPKPWWCEELNEMWTERCIYEKSYLNFKGNSHEKRQLQMLYKEKQDLFDKRYRQIKRRYEHEKLSEIKVLEKSNPRKFWEALKQLGPKKCQILPEEIMLNDGSFSTDPDIILEEWFKYFRGIFQDSQLGFDDELFDLIVDKKCLYENGEADPPYNFRYDMCQEILNDSISREEIKTLIRRAKCGKAIGIEGIPNEVLKNDSSITILHSFFSLCFEHGLIPTSWSQVLIKPIPKSQTMDKRNPKMYRGISLISCIGKLYSAFLNQRLTVFCEVLGVIVEEQNGFRSTRSCLDHIYSLSSIIRNRLVLKKSTFCCFVDISKAFDSVERDCLLYLLQYNGIRGKMYHAIKSILMKQDYAVKVNEKRTNWFDSVVGVRQGDPLSPSLFSLYINDLAVELNELNLGVQVGDEIVNVLLYADDLVILAESEAGLQQMLNKCSDWCHQWRLNINSDKSKVVHFRNQSSPRTEFCFSCSGKNIEVISQYKYLGIIFQEFMNYDIGAKVLADSASRAFGYIISKFKSFKTIDYYIFTKLFESCLIPIMDYASGVWGFKDFNSLTVIQNKISRYFLGVHKFAPNLGVWGELGWVPANIRRKVEMVRLWCRLIRMDDIRLTKRLFITDLYNCKFNNMKNWCYELQCIFEQTNQMYLFETETTNFKLQSVLNVTKERLLEHYKNQWYENLNNYPKLRTYKLFKSEFELEKYVCSFLSRSERSFLAQFRLGILPLQIETGRFTTPLTPLENRLCLVCNQNKVEDEFHFLLECPLYDLERISLFENLLLTDCLFVLNSENLLRTIVTYKNPKIIARYIKECYLKRNRLLYNS